MPCAAADALDRRIVWQAVAVPRDPRQIQLEIDAARESLAATLDQLTYRTSPTAPPGQGPGRRRSASCRRRRAWPPPAPSACWSPSPSSRGSGTATTDRAVPRPPRPDPVGPGQESVWDYPRPPVGRGDAAARRRRARRPRPRRHGARRPRLRDQPPAGLLRARGTTSPTACSSAGRAARGASGRATATYWDAVVDGRRVPAVGWSYEDPTPGYEHLRGAVAFYPGRRRPRHGRRRGRPPAGRGTSTAAGSPTRSSDRSRASPARWAGRAGTHRAPPPQPRTGRSCGRRSGARAPAAAPRCRAPRRRTPRRPARR